MNKTDEHLPIKVIFPNTEDFRPPKPGGSEPKDFTKSYDEARQSLIDGICKVNTYYERIFAETNLPVVARVKLREKALAKSHRPASLFTECTCPVIGAEDFGELLISVLPDSLSRLADTISENKTESIKNDVSKIISIKPFKENDALGNWTVDNLYKFLLNNDLSTLKINLFNHRDFQLNHILEAELFKLSGQIGIKAPELLKYNQKLRIFRVQFPNDKDIIIQLCSFVGTQRIDVFEQFNVGTQTTPIRPLSEDDLPPPSSDEDYPVIGIVDTGTDPNNPFLQAWIETRDESLIPPIDQDNDHGSLVAGMLINGRSLNYDNVEFPSGHAKIVDVVAIPKSGTITEDDLIEALRHAFQSNPDVKIWNVSMNSKHRCRNDRFSDCAIALDSLQDEYGVLIINSAGNYQNTPLYPWPRIDLKDEDRLLCPGDSLRSITVGSIAHLASNQACAQPGDPSPFTRKGPGAAFVPKPDVTHFGGNATSNFHFAQMGVLSVDGSGNIAETIGTSFASPLVALTVAQFDNFLEDSPSRHLLKAFIIHSSVLHSPKVTADFLPYTGFGKPPPVEEMIRCRPWEATLVFDLDLPFSRRHFHKTDFPVPPCLHRNNKVFGEIILTLVYNPPVDPLDGAAYSQVNVDVSLGVCWIRDGKEEYSGRKVIPYPKDIKDLFEKNQIEHGFKWSPVKVYKSQFSRLISRDTWRITLEMIARKPSLNLTSQPVALIATIRDPDRQQPVYNEVVQMMNRAGWITQNLRIKEDIRIRMKS